MPNLQRWNCGGKNGEQIVSHVPIGVLCIQQAGVQSVSFKHSCCRRILKMHTLHVRKHARFHQVPLHLQCRMDCLSRSSLDVTSQVQYVPAKYVQIGFWAWTLSPLLGGLVRPSTPVFRFSTPVFTHMHTYAHIHSRIRNTFTRWTWSEISRHKDTYIHVHTHVPKYMHTQDVFSKFS